MSVSNRRDAEDAEVTQRRDLKAMQHAKIKHTYRWVAYLLPVLLLLPFAEIRNHAEETVEVVTDRHPIEAHPIYLIAAPPQEKMGPRPLNVPVVSARIATAKNDSAAELQLQFAMSAASAVRIGNGLIEDSDAQTALQYLEYARKQDPNSVDVLTGLARCYYELKRDDRAAYDAMMRTQAAKLEARG